MPCLGMVFHTSALRRGELLGKLTASMSNFTANQQLAINACGNVLVEAGAGSGKTRTLVQRCLARVLDAAAPVSMDEILMVTFTEAAAAEMRRRIGEQLARAVAAEQTVLATGQGSPGRCERLEEQLALLDTARISTLHGFCLQLVREHFHELGLDPQLAVLDDAQARVLAARTLERLLTGYYAGTDPGSLAVQELIMTHGGGQDGRIRELILRMHRYSRSLDDAAGWIAAQQAMFADPEPHCWQAWLREGVAGWMEEWSAKVAGFPPDNLHAARCRELLNGSLDGNSRESLSTLMEELLAVDIEWPRGTKGKHRPPLAQLFEDAAFLNCLISSETALGEDWTWVRSHLGTLLDLVLEFGEDFAAAKREQGALDFADLEQFSLRLLWDANAQNPTAIAREWQARLRLVFVDEYQDINAAQDRIISCLGREGSEANRFLVGDVKQSIYRFRLANPRIFQSYARAWREGEPHSQVIPLADNFRSAEGVLEFVNAFFGEIMQEGVGGIVYDEEACLRFGNREGRIQLTRAGDEAEKTSRVELLLRLTEDRQAGDDSGDDDGLAELSTTEHEARMVARRLLDLKESGFRVWDETLGDFRPVDWPEMAVLLRSPRNRAEVYVREFARLGVPLEAERSVFFDSTEVSDLLSVLKLLDNPLQDVPLLAVLRSPLVGLTVDELAVVRLALRRGMLWQALQELHSAGEAFGQRFASEPAVLSAFESARPKVASFLEAFARWRSLARQGSLAACLESVLDETHYEDWLGAQPRGSQQLANVRRLLGMARSFDEFQRQGLYRFLLHVEEEQSVEARERIAPGQQCSAVRLLSIHQSKGLEFPVVAVAGLATKFNLRDLSADIIMDEHYGLCPHIRPPGSQTRYPSLPHWLASRRQRNESLGEEIRLLYVAMTRARDKLILSGSATSKKAEADWNDDTATLSAAQIGSATHPLDWLGPLLPRFCGTADWAGQEAGHAGLLAWRIATDEPVKTAAVGGETSEPITPADPDELSALIRRLNWRYPHDTAVAIAAKTSVSEVRQRLNAEVDEEARTLPDPAASGRIELRKRAPRSGEPAELDAAAAGTAHHAFLQHLSLAGPLNRDGLQAEANRLVAGGKLTAAEGEVLDLDALSSFWESSIGKELLTRRDVIVRELPFTARFDPKEAGLNAGADAGLDSEFVVVQGVVDLVAILPEEIWLVDFKTDDVSGEEVTVRSERYGSQMRLYALALARIYGRPVTKCWLHFLRARATVSLPAGELSGVPKAPTTDRE